MIYSLVPGNVIAVHGEAGGVIHTYVGLARSEEWFAPIGLSDAAASAARIAADFEGWGPELREQITVGQTPPIARLLRASLDHRDWARLPGREASTIIGSISVSGVSRFLMKRL